MNKEPLKYISDLAGALYREFANRPGTGVEIVEKRDMVDRIIPVRLHANIQNSEKSIDGFVGLDKNGFRFTVWKEMPGHKNTRTEEWISPDPILQINCRGRCLSAFDSQKGEWRNDNVIMKFGYHDDELDLTDIVGTNTVAEVIQLSREFLRGLKKESYWEFERYPHLRPTAVVAA